MLIQMRRAGFDTAATAGTEKVPFIFIRTDKFVVVPIIKTVGRFGPEIIMILNLKEAFWETGVPWQASITGTVGFVIKILAGAETERTNRSTSPAAKTVVGNALPEVEIIFSIGNSLG